MKKVQYKTVNEYIAGFPKDVQRPLKEVRHTLRAAVSDREEVISYQIPALKSEGRFIIHFAAWKSHIALYPVPKGNALFRKKLAPYISGKSTARFPLDKPLPVELIRMFAEYRVKETKQRAGRSH